MSRSGGIAYEEKGGDTLRTFGFESELPPTIPSQVYYSSGLGSGLKFQPQSQQPTATNVARMSATSLMRSNSKDPAFTYNPAASLTSSAGSAQSAMSSAGPYVAGNGTNNRGQSTGSIMVVNGGGQQYLTDDTSSGADTMRSRMPDPFYNQSQLARQPSDAYDPAQRQVNRVSELSSLSSGFGDGEIPAFSLDTRKQPGPLSTSILPAPPPVSAGPTLAMSSGASGRFSWMHKDRMSRETAYSESSEDQPAKFRSVNSWVKQQTGRVRRGQASIDTTTSTSAGSNGVDGGNIAMRPGDEPGIPHPMPEEQRLTMMMDDEEVPRHPDTVPGIQAP